MLNVLLTIDTEAYPISKNWKQERLHTDVERDIYGQAGGRRVGLDYQLEVLKRYGLKAVFMLETLFSAVPEVGPQPLEKIIRSIQTDNHDIQLHAHPEWIPFIPKFPVPYRNHLLYGYSLPEQEAIIRFAVQRLKVLRGAESACFQSWGVCGRP